VDDTAYLACRRGHQKALESRYLITTKFSVNLGLQYTITYVVIKRTANATAVDAQKRLTMIAKSTFDGATSGSLWLPARHVG